MSSLNTVKCPNCGNENLNTNIRCEKCGKQLITEDQIQDMDLNSAIYIQQDPVQDAKDTSHAEVLSGITTIFEGIIFSGVLSMIAFKVANNIAMIAGMIFLICGIILIICGISMIIKGINTTKNINDYVNGKFNMDKLEENEKNFEKIENIASCIYPFCFLLFWFGFLIALDTAAIKSWSDGGNILFFFSLIFWAVGIYTFINNIKKVNKIKSK